MTHVMSAAEIKTGRRQGASRDKPRPGTASRRLYDLLMASAGHWVTVFPEDFSKVSPALKSMVNAISLSYRLDIRARRTTNAYDLAMTDLLLAGEYVGRGYLDYVADPTLALPKESAP